MRRLFLGAFLLVCSLGAVAAVLGGRGAQTLDTFFQKAPGAWVPPVAGAAAAAGGLAVPGGVAVRGVCVWACVSRLSSAERTCEGGGSRLDGDGTGRWRTGYSRTFLSPTAYVMHCCSNRNFRQRSPVVPSSAPLQSQKILPLRGAETG